MPKSDLIQLDGQIVKVCSNGLYKVKLEKKDKEKKDVEVSARLCGKMRRYNIQVVNGDRVTVGFSPHDLNLGLIIYRYR